MTSILLTDATKIEVNRFGIPEPVEGIEVSPTSIDVIFVPLLAFDKAGNRLGYGKGFYDIFLKQCPASVLKVGLSLFPAEDAIPAETHDQPLDYCITPSKIYSF
jgi:5-formyltetrahydrofolate cyclo-ligase